MISLVPLNDAQAQTPLFETRAVWFATVLADGGWPAYAGQPAGVQESELRARIRTAKANGMNTFVFQAVSRADAMYPSERLPWSWQLRSAGEDPGYDPLDVAVDEAHKLGMELHAWVNVFRVGDGSTLDRYEGVVDPQHVAFARPEWVRERASENGGTQLWIDPASDEARAWLVGNVLEIVENYDVDAVHYDFIRYPTGGFDDDLAKCQFEGGGTCADVDDWRRANVTTLVEASSQAVHAEKPWVTVGATPIGHYGNDYPWAHLSGYHDVFQASREWARSGYVDYLAPQIYWGTSEKGGPPRFEVLAQEWVDSTPRPVFMGIAAYLTAEPVSLPAEDLAAQIDVSRKAGAAGQMFFRYDHLLSNSRHIRPAYEYRSLTAQNRHRFEFHDPSIPDPVTIRTVGSSTVEISWDPVEGTPHDPVHAYAVFRREGGEPDTESAEELFEVVGATTFSEGFSTPPSQDVYYRVAAVSKLGGLSGGSHTVSTAAFDLAALDEQPAAAFRILSIYPNPTLSEAAVAVDIDRGGRVQVRIFDMLGRQVALPHDGILPRGRQEIRLDVSSLSTGTYVVEVRMDDGRAVRRLVKL